MKSSRNIRHYFRITANRRRTLPILSVAVVTLVVISGVAAAPTDDKAIRPFHFTASKEALADMRKRIAATRWPDKETVNDASQGVQLATIQKLARYWGTDYDWRKCEAELNALARFITTIDGLDIHLRHVRLKNAHGLPVVTTA